MMEFIFYYLITMVGAIFIIGTIEVLNYVTMGTFGIVIAAMIDILIKLITFGSFVGLWVSTVGVITKPLDNTFNDFIKKYLILRYNENNNRNQINKIQSKILEVGISKSNIVIRDYFIFKLATFTNTKRLIFVGCLNNWYKFGTNLVN